MKRTLHFYFLLAGLLLVSNGVFAQTWEERVVNGDFEGSDFSSFAVSVKNEGSQDLDSNDIVVDDDDANNHCAKISFTANPWNTEFVIKLTEPLAEGDSILFAIRAKTSSSRIARLVSDEVGMIVVDGGGVWTTFTYKEVVKAELKGCQAITLRFNRTSSKSDVFHFDDISLKVLKDAPIEFADAKVKEICVNLWDANKDGELGIREAATVKYISDNIFTGKTDITSFDELQYFVGVESLRGFQGCTNLTSVIIPNSVKTIENLSFDGCTSLKSVVIPNSVEIIGSCSFQNCSSLTSIELPNSLLELGHQVFNGCSSLTSLTIPKSVWLIQSNPVAGCNNLTSLTVDEDNIHFDSRDNCNAIIHTSSISLVGGCKNTVIPSSVTSINGWAFSGCDLTAVTIPSSVTFIGYDAFEGCDNLESIEVESNNSVFDSRDNCNAIITTAENMLVVGCKTTIIPSSVTSIGGGAFYGSGLTAITIPDGVTNIEGGAFQDCTGLTSVSIPNSVTRISIGAFCGCVNLEEVISHIEEPFEISQSVFSRYGINDEWAEFTAATLYVPVGTKTKYEATPAWNLFHNIVEKDLTSINETKLQTSSAITPAIYSLSGQKLTTPKKGINIINGKKVVIK
mgnify:CR=1 FL=1